MEPPLDSRIASRRPSNSERCANGTTVTGSRRAGEPRTMSSRCAAYSDGVAPAPTTRSSAARSASARSRRAAAQTTGLNQWMAQASCATRCATRSPRRMCASSWSSTISRRSAFQASAESGSTMTDRRNPEVHGMATRGLSRSRGRAATFIRAHATSSASVHSRSSRSRARRVMDPSTRNPAASRSTRRPEPASQMTGRSEDHENRFGEGLHSVPADGGGSGTSLTFSCFAFSAGSVVPSLRGSSRTAAMDAVGMTGSRKGMIRARSGTAMTPPRAMVHARCRSEAELRLTVRTRSAVIARSPAARSAISSSQPGVIICHPPAPVGSAPPALPAVPPASAHRASGRAP